MVMVFLALSFCLCLTRCALFFNKIAYVLLRRLVVPPEKNWHVVPISVYGTFSQRGQQWAGNFHTTSRLERGHRIEHGCKSKTTLLSLRVIYQSLPMPHDQLGSI